MSCETNALYNAYYHNITIEQITPCAFFVCVDGKRYGTPFSTRESAQQYSISVRNLLYQRYLKNRQM